MDVPSTSDSPSVSKQKSTLTARFQSALVGNRICDIRITEVASSTHRITSELDAGLLLYTTELAVVPAKQIVFVLAEQLENSSDEIIGVRLEGTDSEHPVMIVGLDITAAIRIPLRHPTNAQWQDHIRRTMATQKRSYKSEQHANVILKSKLAEREKELKSLRRHATWQEKEIDLLKIFVPPRGSSMSQTASHSHCGSCNCHKKDIIDVEGDNDDNDSMVGIADDLVMDKSEMLADIDMDVESAETADASPLLMDSSSPGVPRPSSSNAGTSPIKKQSDEDLLWGVAQFILCQLCPEQAQDFKVMESHFLAAHVDKEKRHCAACPSESLSDLAQHVQQHTNRVYACEFCGKRGRKHFLKSHIRTHTGEKPFGCETCGRAFADTSTLRRHRLIHSGEKKHACPICGRGIARKDNMKGHIRSHHPLHDGEGEISTPGSVIVVDDSLPRDCKPLIALKESDK